jgi:integrase
MASLMQQGDRFYCQFVYMGKRHCFPLGKVSCDEAEAKINQADYLLMRLKQGLLQIPAGMDIISFLEFDGKPPAPTVTPRDAPTLKLLRDEYLRVHRGSLEPNTITGMELHFKHLVSILGEGFPIKQLDQATLQKYASDRSLTRFRGRPISPATVKKELVTLRTAWNWGSGMGLVTTRFPALRQIRLKKLEEKPPFQTRQEIERRIARGGLSEEKIQELWDCLFLQLPEIETLLAHAKKKATLPWIYPVFCFAAHTGARRSEIIRAEIEDVDFEGKTVLIRERKRAHDKKTTRRVPLTPFLASVLRDWLKKHPGGHYLFCQADHVERSKKRSRTTGHKGQKTRAKTLGGRTATITVRARRLIEPLTKNEFHDHFKRTLADSEWRIVRGAHVLRHSFASNCAARGVDQRLLDAWLGHTTEIRKRYLHLIPSNEQSAIQSVFG